MNSRRLGHVALNSCVLEEELWHVLRLSGNRQYSDFADGSWEHYVLRNGSGSSNDVLFRGYEGPSRGTDLIRDLSYLSSIVTETFRLDYLKWMRLFVFRGAGVLVPHRDFLEIGQSFIRLHMPLRTDRSCLHSEGDCVFHMRRGEVWYLDSTSIHAACTSSDVVRVSLALDFAPGTSPDKVLRANAATSRLPQPRLVHRPAVDLERVYQSCHSQEIRTFDDLLRLLWRLSRVHFEETAGAGDVYDWLVEIASRTGREELVRDAKAIRRYFIEQRRPGERLGAHPSSAHIPSCVGQHRLLPPEKGARSRVQPFAALERK